MEGIQPHITHNENNLMRMPEQALLQNSSRITISHDLRKVEKLKFDNQWFYYKYFRVDTHPSLLELEAFSGDIYHLLLGKGRAPRFCIVEDDHQHIKGILVESIDTFRSEKSSHFTDIAKYISGKLIEVLVAAFFMQEDDLHNENLGTDSNDIFCKIDHDMSLWPISIEYKGDRIQQVFPYEGILWDIKNFLNKSGSTSFINNKISFFFSQHDAERLKNFIFSLSPAEREKAKFPFTLRDIDLFPFLNDAHPYYWPVKWLPVFSNPHEADKFMHHPQVNFDKWMIFTMICLTPKPFFVSSAKHHIRDEKLMSEAAMHVTSSKRHLTKALIRSYKFREFIGMLNSPDGQKHKESLWQRFEDFNKNNPTYYQFKREDFDAQFKYLLSDIAAHEKELYYEPQQKKSSFFFV